MINWLNCYVNFFNSILLDSGAHSTVAVPVSEGNALLRAISRSSFGGRDLLDHLTALITEAPHDSCFCADR